MPRCGMPVAGLLSALCRERFLWIIYGEDDSVNIEIFKDNPMLNQVISLVITAILVSVIVFFLLKATKRFFIKVRSSKKWDNLNLRFIENTIRFLIFFIGILWIVLSSDLTRSFGQTIFTGTAVIAGVVGFASQTVLADLICGVIISSTKPFDIGNRITLDTGISGVVKDITLRHVVLRGMDTQTYIIPNSKMTGYVINNMSYKTATRSVDFRFSVAYTSDPELASRVISEAVQASPYSVPGFTSPSGEKTYADVYFLSYEASSLTFGTTAYYEPSCRTEVFKNDINTRVKKALAENNIEIPYSYMNVIMKNP